MVGVLSPEIEFGNLGEIDVWLPLRVDPAGPRDARNLRFLARLKDGVTFDQAAAEMASIGAALASEYPRTNGGWTIRLVPVSDLLGGDGFWVVIALFLLSIGLLMAIATANVSNLVMVRTIARARELAVRTALGARKGRLIRQFVTEGLVLSLAGALVALPIAWAGLQSIQLISDEAIFQQLTIDLHELSFVAILALICPLVFSIAPIRAAVATRHAAGAGGGRPRHHGVAARTRHPRHRAGRPRGDPADGVEPRAPQHADDVCVADRHRDRPRCSYSASSSTTRSIHPSMPRARRQKPPRNGLREVAGVETVAMLSALPILGDSGPVAMTIDNVVADAKEAQADGGGDRR